MNSGKLSGLFLSYSTDRRQERVCWDGKSRLLKAAFYFIGNGYCLVEFMYPIDLFTQHFANIPEYEFSGESQFFIQHFCRS